VPPAGTQVQRVPADHPSITAALAALAGTGGIVEVTDSRTYAETPLLRVPAGAALVLRAANGARPLLRLGGDMLLEVTGDGGDASVTLDGLVVAGGALRLGAGTATGLRLLTLRHATLVPGQSLGADGAPALPGMPSLLAEATRARVVLEGAITGPLRLGPRTRLEARDSIIDANAPTNAAIGGGLLALEALTVIGRIAAAEVTQISDCILHAEGPRPAVGAARVQSGCVRFSWLPPGTLLPARYPCRMPRSPPRSSGAARAPMPAPSARGWKRRCGRCSPRCATASPAMRSCPAPAPRRSAAAPRMRASRARSMRNSRRSARPICACGWTNT
jgi:hypothetical protein